MLLVSVGRVASVGWLAAVKAKLNELVENLLWLGHKINDDGFSLPSLPHTPASQSHVYVSRYR